MINNTSGMYVSWHEDASPSWGGNWNISSAVAETPSHADNVWLSKLKHRMAGLLVGASALGIAGWFWRRCYRASRQSREARVAVPNNPRLSGPAGVGSYNIHGLGSFNPGPYDSDADSLDTDTPAVYNIGPCNAQPSNSHRGASDAGAYSVPARDAGSS